jgi:hypothetical protein
MMDPTFSAEELLGWVEQQVDLGARRPGSAAGLASERLLMGLLEQFGLTNVRAEPIPITHWEAKKARLEVAAKGGPFTTVSAFPIPYVVFTGDEGVEGPLVFADRRTFHHGAARRQWRGAVVVTEIGFPPLPLGLLRHLALGVYDPGNLVAKVNHPATWVRLGWHLYREAARAGAVGFVGVLGDQPGGTARMYAPYGFKEMDILDRPLPGFWVGRGAGAALLEQIRLGGARARLHVTGTRVPGLTHNLVGEVAPRQAAAPGPEEVVVLSCHHDSPFDSPVEDASGVSVVLALARHFAREPLAHRRLIVVLTAGHFYGSLGTRTFIREHPDVVRRTVVEVSIEHVAREAAEDAAGRLVATGHPEATGIFVPFADAVRDVVLEAVRRHDLTRTVLLPAEGPLGPYPPTDGGDWWASGVPVVNHISNPVYLLTDDDALEWVDRDRLPRVAGTFAEVIARLDDFPRERIAARDAPLSQALMWVLRHVIQAKTTHLGQHPVY